MEVSLKTRNDAVELFLKLIRPLKVLYSPGHAFLHVWDSGVNYGEKAARMEGFARVMWGLGPLWSADNSKLPLETQREIDDWLKWYQEGIVHGTSPEDEEYWGDIFDYDQKMVEAPAVAFSMLLNPKALWEDLTDQQRKNLYGWLNQMNDHDMPKNNWRYFRIMTNMAFRILGLPWSEEKTKEDFDIVENSYIGDGWYFDGNPGQVDYYVAFAIHFYGLVYSKWMSKAEPERCHIFRERSTQFFHDFVYWFANDGVELPFGRSLTYRYAHCSPFVAMAYAGLDLDYGILKNLVLRNLESWMRRPIFDNGGALTIGYGYPNIAMSENYNGCGSPYWSSKAFVMLGLDDDHPFWKAEPKEYSYESKKYLKHTHMIINHDEYNHVLAYVTGQHCKGDHGQSPAKYEKFVYSNQFGFSVSKGTSLEEGAFDNTLAFSHKGENRFCMRYGLTDFYGDEERLVSKYSPIKGVKVISTVVPCSPWHVRVHQITNKEAIKIAEGGFSLPQEEGFRVKAGRMTGRFEEKEIHRIEKGIYASFPWGCSGIVSETGQETELEIPFANTNLFYNLTVIPMVKAELEPGIHVIVTSVAADFHKSWEELLEEKPEVRIDKGEVKVIYKGKTVKVSLEGGLE